MAIPVREYFRRGWKFGIVGIFGFIVNQGFLMLLVGVAGMQTWSGSAIAIELSIIGNWFINDSWTWRDRRNANRIKRLMRYNLSAGFTAYGVNYPILLILSSQLGINYAIANIIGVGFASLANFLINHHWTYAKAET
ncbi:GtrA family protein [bacterium]|nr:GtrA family protein [bacterium]